MNGDCITWALSSHPDVIDLIKEITAAETIEAGCASLASFYGSLECELLSVKFYDCKDDTQYIRPYFIYPDGLLQVSSELMAMGGCPFSKEAKRIMQPFDSYSIDQSRYASFTERRFFREISKTGHKRIAVLPIMIGRGIALITVGLFTQPFSGPLRDTICNSIAHIVAAFISRFPEISTLFEEKVLTGTERKLLRKMCDGQPRDEIAYELGISELTVDIFLTAAKQKMGADNVPQLIYKSMVAGEISSLRT